jgi:hypothetical protein
MGAPSRFVAADPYAWPWNGDVRRENTAVSTSAARLESLPT